MLKAKYWHTCPKQQKSQIQINTILCTQKHHTKLLIAILLLRQKGWIVPKNHIYPSDCIFISSSNFYTVIYILLHYYMTRYLANLFIQSLNNSLNDPLRNYNFISMLVAVCG